MVSIRFEKDTPEAKKSKELTLALREDKIALEQFTSLVSAHQNYFHKHVESAKGLDINAGRIVNVITAMYKSRNLGR